MNSEEYVFPAEDFEKFYDKQFIVTKMKVSLSDWKTVLASMTFYNRENGYVDFDKEGMFKFFDSDPYINGVQALYVTKPLVEFYISEYE